MACPQSILAMPVLALILLVSGSAESPGPSHTRVRLRGTTPAADSVRVGVFEGRTPCGSIANDFTGFPALNCEKIKWEVTLYRARASGRPQSYVYRGTRSSRSGAWTISRGAAHDPRATVYRLHYDSNRTLHLLPVGEDVLLVLDGNLQVLVGDASWSYALNRMDRRR